METPLSDELIQELNEIVKLPKDEQSLKLKDFFKKLNPEQIEFLKKYQTQQCVFCGIAVNQINSYKVYEDEDAVAVLDINPASQGHVIVIPKMHLKYSYELSNKVFEVANLVSKRMKEVLNADTNILISNGEDAGEKFEHVVINVIPRYKDDGINLNWEFTKTSEKQLKELSSKLKFEIKKPEVVRKIEEREGSFPKRVP